jgi:transporter family protein
MSSQLIGLLIGGLLPALFYGIAGIFAKVSTNAGMSVSGHLICIGVTVSVTGVLLNYVLPGSLPSNTAIVSSSLMGIFWSFGTGCVALGLLKYRASLAQLVPLYNMNTLVTAILALILFSEWRNLNVGQFTLGMILVVLGGIVVSRA